MVIKVVKNSTGLTDNYVKLLFKKHGLEYLNKRFGADLQVLKSEEIMLAKPVEELTYYQKTILKNKLNISYKQLPKGVVKNYELNPMHKVYDKYKNYEFIANKMGISRQRVCQIMHMLYVDNKMRAKLKDVFPELFTNND